MKTAIVRVLREKFDPYLRTDNDTADTGAAVAAMRDAIISVAGYDPEHRWPVDPG
jgi:hypothetical protein